jgi:site-specific DNA recombinase
MAHERPVRCAALYRVSTARQAQTRDDDESLPLQRNAVRAYVAGRPGWTLVQEFAEEGVSAFRYSSADRDILQDVLREARRGAFDVLLLFKADRLSRQAMEYPFILSTLEKAGVRVISVADEPGGKELKTHGQYDKILRFLEGWQAETESYNTSIRVTERMRQLAAQGPWWSGGQPPYGYRYDPAATPVPLRIDPAEADVIRRVFAWYLDEGLGGPRIVDRLNADGVPTRHGKRWHLVTLYRMMCNPILTGRLAYGRTSQRRGEQFVKPWHDLDGVILSDPVPALVLLPPDRWQAAMARMAAYNRRVPGLATHSRADSGPLLLTGIARCRACGGGFGTHQHWTRRRQAGGDKTYVYRVYQCETAAMRGARACPGQHTFSPRKVEPPILAAIQRTLTELNVNAVVAEAIRYAEQTVWHQTARQQQAARRLAEARQLHAAWLERLNQHLLHPEQSLYSEDTLARQIREAEARLEAAQADVDAIAAAVQNVAAQRARLEAFLAHADRWWQTFLAADPARQKHILRQIVERIEMGREGFVIHYAITPEALGAAGAEVVRWQLAAGWGAS